MKRYVLPAMLAAAALALVLVPWAACAAEDLPFRAEYASTYTHVYDGPYAVHTGEGTGTYLGNFTALAYAHLQGSGNKAMGRITFTSAAGDSLEVVFDQEWDEASSSYVGSYTVVGGTGRFAGAGGGGMIVTKVGPMPIPVALEGTINF